MPITENADPYLLHLSRFRLGAVVVQCLHHERRHIDLLVFVGHDERMLKKLDVVRTFVIILLQAKQTTCAPGSTPITREWHILSRDSRS